MIRLGNLPDIAISRDLRRSIAITGYQGTGATDPPGAAGVQFVAKSEPHHTGHLLVFGGSSYIRNWSVSGLGGGEALAVLGLLAAGCYLDEAPDGFDVGESEPGVFRIELRAEWIDSLPAQEATTDEVVDYFAAKLYQAHRLEIGTARLGWADEKRLGVTQEKLKLALRLGDDDLWLYEGADSWRPTRKLLKEVASGRLPGLTTPGLVGVLDLLQAPRYAAARHAIETAMSDMERDPPDYAGAVGEAVKALESVALHASGTRKGTLKDALRELQKRGKLKPPLHKIPEDLYAYRGNEAGVAHGGVEPPNIQKSEAEWLFNMAAASIRYLLTLDR